MSVIMSDMKTKAELARKPARRRKPAAVQDTFTVRDMNRRPQVVLNAARKLGRVMISSRGGGMFVLAPEAPGASRQPRDAEAFMERQRRLREHMRSIGFHPPSLSESESITRMIAGDEP